MLALLLWLLYTSICVLEVLFETKELAWPLGHCKLGIEKVETFFFNEESSGRRRRCLMQQKREVEGIGNGCKGIFCLHKLPF